jgi:hypothetical protein
MKYRLWDTDISRLFGTFDTEAEALDLVRSLLESYGAGYADELALGCERSDGSFTDPLTGAALVERARRVAKEPESAPGFMLTRTGMAGAKRAS